MMGNDARFILRSSLTSPYGRKVRIAAEVLGLAARITLAPADTLDPGDPLRHDNPLGKMPCLLLSDGTAIFDSRVIVELLQEMAGVDLLLPVGGSARYPTLTRATLADGVTDAALLMVYERRFREAAAVSEQWLAHQEGKIARALSVFAQSPPDVADLDLAAIGLVCALGYLDWRQPVAWRPRYPALVDWLARMEGQHPALRNNPPPSG